MAPDSLLRAPRSLQHLELATAEDEWQLKQEAQLQTFEASRERFRLACPYDEAALKYEVVLWREEGELQKSRGGFCFWVISIH